MPKHSLDNRDSDNSIFYIGHNGGITHGELHPGQVLDTIIDKIETFDTLEGMKIRLDELNIEYIDHNLIDEYID